MPPPADDPYNLERFVAAQRTNYAEALAELKEGRKRSHWMWYVFPQVAGLGSSPMAQRYAIRSRAEAEAYLRHPLLGARLVDCAQALLSVKGKSAHEIMGSPDDVKLRSSLTLFAAISPPGSLFAIVLDRYYGGQADARTLEFLSIGENKR
jgi:uncharacterized protein (DUF1810 family)